MAESFKMCALCERQWPDREAFLADEGVEAVGYQPNFDELELGYILFSCHCDNTLAVRVECFADLHEGEIHTERLTGSEHCPGMCLREPELVECPAKCECAWVRKLLTKLAARNAA